MHTLPFRKWLVAGSVGILIAAVVALNAFTPKPAPLTDDTEWAQYGHDNSQSKFSTLAQINTTNVQSLKLVDSTEDTSARGANIFWNPLVVRDKLIGFMPSQRLVAIRPVSGEVIWSFTPDATDISIQTRATTYLKGENGKPDRIFFVYGSTLYSIDAATGRLIDSFGKGGRVDFYDGLDVPAAMRSRIPVTTNSPGVIYNDLLIIGCKVPDQLPSVSGDIRAFNINTGKLSWVFHTIPRKGEFGANTWGANARLRNGGANCWGGMALDAKRGIVYVPTASPSFDFYGADRPGQNLFANCLLALNAKTGQRLWHFQTTHHDLWDRDNGSPPNLVTVTHNGKQVDAVALVTKMGYVFLFDRVSGKPLFPIREMPVPTNSTMPGEKPWPTQPIPVKPAPFARQGYTPDVYETLSPQTVDFIKKKLRDRQFTTGIYQPPSLQGSIVLPAAHGGANWGGASYNPATGVIFVNAIDMPWYFAMIDLKRRNENNQLSGANLYKMHCNSCHGTDLKGTNYGPDISERVKTYAVDKLENFIRKGASPMPAFSHLPKEQLTAIVSFLKQIKPAQTTVAEAEADDKETSEPYGFSGYNFFLDQQGNPAIKPPFGTLTAINLHSGTILWQVPLGEDPKLAQMGIKNSGMHNRGGGIATAGGLVFISGTGDKVLRAFDQKTGAVLWQYTLPGTSLGIPSTYAIDGKQYLTVSVNPTARTDYKGGYLTFSL